MIRTVISTDFNSAYRALENLRKNTDVKRSEMRHAVRTAALPALGVLQNDIARRFNSKQSTKKLSKSYKLRIDNNVRRRALTVLFASKAPHARIHETGGTVRPRNSKYLAVPLTAAARRRRPRSWGKALFMITSRKGNKLLVRKRGKRGITPHYVLKKEIRIKKTAYLTKARPKVTKMLALTLEPQLANLVKRSGF